MRLVSEKPVSKEDVNITSAFFTQTKTEIILRYKFCCKLLQKVNGKFIAEQEFKSFYLISSEKELGMVLDEFIGMINLQIASGKICIIHNNCYKYYKIRKTLKINS